MTSKINCEALSRRKFIIGTAAVSSQLLSPSLAFASKAINQPVSIKKMNIDHFVQDCINANKESEPQRAVKEVLEKAASAHKSMLAALGEPSKAGINVLHSSKTLTIFNASWTPQMNLLPHSHLMWALIGIYTGREDNIMWKKSNNSIKAYGAEALFEGDVAALPDDAIHSVTNPLQRFTGGLHIYGGDFFHTTRSQWNPETLAEEPSDGDDIRAIFARENERRARRGLL